MKNKVLITVMGCCIMFLSAIAAATGIWSSGGSGSYEYNSIRGQKVMIYGKGLYQHMSAEVAPQGIAQDYVTLFGAIPLLLISLLYARRGGARGRLLLAGVLGYFLVTYLFYLVMGMYNYMFLVYVALLGLSFFSFVLTMFSFPGSNPVVVLDQPAPVRFIGGFLVFNSIAIALLWLSIVIPPLLNSSIIPAEVAHYTTLIVQGLDLGLLLPAAFIIGVLLMKRKAAGFLYAPVYCVFLSLLMTALLAKIIAMSILGYNIIPAVFIIPVFLLGAIICAFILLKNVREISSTKRPYYVR